MPVRRQSGGEVVSRRTAVGRGAVRLCVRGTVSGKSATKPLHLPVSVQGESGVVPAAGQEVQPQHLQVGTSQQKGPNPAEGFVRKIAEFAAFTPAQTNRTKGGKPTVVQSHRTKARRCETSVLYCTLGEVSFAFQPA